MYSRDGFCHFTAIKEMDKSPMHYAWNVTHNKFDTRGMRLGRAVHALVLQDIEPYVFTDGDRRGAKWKEFVEERSLQAVELVDDYYQRDNISDVLTTPEYDSVRWMRDRVHADPEAREWLAICTEREVSVEWNMMGHPWRGKIDARSPLKSHILDLKSTKCAAKYSFLRDAGRMHYDAQLVAYDIASGIVPTGSDTEWGEYALIAVENVAPFAVQVYRIPNLRKDQALERLERWMMDFDACVKAGSFGRAYHQGAIEWDAEITFGQQDEEEDED